MNQTISSPRQSGLTPSSRGDAAHSRINRTCQTGGESFASVPVTVEPWTLRTASHSGRNHIFSRAGSSAAMPVGDNRGMAATPAEGTARNAGSRNCVQAHNSQRHLTARRDGHSFAGGESFLAALLAIVLIGLLAIAIGSLGAMAWDQPEPSSGLYDVGNPPAKPAGPFRNKMSTMVDIRAGFQRKTHVLTPRSAPTENQNHPAGGVRENKGLALRLTAPRRSPERSAK